MNDKIHVMNVSDVIGEFCTNICSEWEETHNCCYIPEVRKYTQSVAFYGRILIL